MTSCWFQHILHLHLAHQIDIAIEQQSYQLLELVVLAKP